MQAEQQKCTMAVAPLVAGNHSRPLLSLAHNCQMLALDCSHLGGLGTVPQIIGSLQQVAVGYQMAAPHTHQKFLGTQLAG